MAENVAKTNNKTVVMVEREIFQEEMRILFGHLSALLTGYTLGRVNNCYLRKVLDWRQCLGARRQMMDDPLETDKVPEELSAAGRRKYI